MMFWFVLSPKSLIKAISQPSHPWLWLPPIDCGTPLLVPRVWLFMLGKDSSPSSRASWSVLAMNPVCFVFAEDKQFLCLCLLRRSGHDGSLYDCLLNSMARVQSVDDEAVLLVMHAHHSEWLESVSPTDRRGYDGCS